MKCVSALALAVTATSALSVGTQPQQALTPEGVAAGQYLIELNPGETRWVSEDQKWELRRNGYNFMDITGTQHTYPYMTVQQRATVEFPKKTSFNETVKPLAKNLDKNKMRKHLEKFTSFYTRYYQSEYGIESAKWLYSQVEDTIKAAGADKHGAEVLKFGHEWGQFSIIARIPGKSEKTVVIGAHQDSINLFLPSFLAAPGADDDGSGTVTILEALRVLLQSEDIVKNKAENTIEFHWYSAEEGGLLGSQAIFSSYAKQGRDIKAMLQQDMTGYVHKTLEAGKEERVGVITDFVDPGLTNFIKVVITEYCDIPYTETKCGYACSDHASASKYGYPSAFVIESDFEYSDDKIHTTDDLIEYLSFDHMLQHAKMTLGLAYELSMADL